MFGNKIKLKKYKNAIEAQQDVLLLKKLSGLAVYVQESHDNEIKSSLSTFGLVCFVCWAAAYYYCAFIVFREDQTILRNLYSTKLREYGDYTERIASLIYVTYAMWKIPFQVGSNCDYFKTINEIDNKLAALGVMIDYLKSAKELLFCSVVQIVIGSTRLLSVLMTLSSIDIPLPTEVIFQASWGDIFALVTTAHYCYYLYFLKTRYKMLNNLLLEIRDCKSWEHLILVRAKRSVNMQKVSQFQEKYICEKIKTCAVVYSMLYTAAKIAKSLYGLALTGTLIFCLLYIVLYLFYFMEATATGLFHDTQRYIYFLVYVFWQIAYTIVVIFLNIFFSEMVVEEASKTSFILHEIINSEIDQSVSKQAMQFSLQVLHQVPVFTACDLTKIDYRLLLEGARSITTVLVVLLQFVTD